MFSVTGMPWSRSTALNTSLSMQSAEASTPAPDVRHAGQLEQPLHRPVLAERPVQDGEDDVDVARGSRRPRGPGGASSSEPGSLCQLGTSWGLELPAAAAVDLHRRRPRCRAAASAATTLAAEATEISFSLDRPPRITAMRRLTASSCVVVVPSPPGEPDSCPTWIVTISPGFASAPAGGSGGEHDPVLARVGDRVDDHGDVQARRPRAATLRRPGSGPTRPGSASSPGPSRPRASPSSPSATLLPAGGSEATTTPCAWSDWISTRETVKPWPSSADFAFANGSPVTSGTCTGFAPRETLIRTVVPFGTRSPACGCCAVTVSACCGRVDADDVRVETELRERRHRLVDVLADHARAPGPAACRSRRSA